MAWPVYDPGMHRPGSSVIASLHDRDFPGWVEPQGSASQARDGRRLDGDGLTDELEALGRQDVRELVSRLAGPMGPPLRGQLQPERRSRSGFLSVCAQRRAMARLLEQIPGLSSRLDEVLAEGCQGGVDRLLREADQALRVRPPESPWSLPAALAADTVCPTRGDWSELGL